MIFRLAFILFISLSPAYSEGTPCWNATRNQAQNCYPDIYDAARGRKPHATSTCGMRRVQEFCHDLPNFASQSRCDYCNEEDLNLRHSPELMTDDEPLSTYWASETLADDRDLNSKSIFITIDLGGQHEVMQTAIIFKSYRPQAMVLYRKYDDSSPWTPWAYFSYMCLKDFQMPAHREGMTIERIDEVVCYELIRTTLDKDNLLRFAPLENRKGENDYYRDRKVMNWALASQVRLEIRKLYTHANINELGHQSLQAYFAAISSFTVMARLFCNGHGSEILHRTSAGPEPRRYCICDEHHHTTGQHCEMCAEGFKAAPWMPATIMNANPCKECNCNGNSNQCEFDPALYVASGNQDGGRCLACENNFMGDKCDVCRPNYRREINRFGVATCVPCGCNAIGGIGLETTGSQCDPMNGHCYCRSNVWGEKCDQCAPGFYGLSTSGCKPCNCHVVGTIDNSGMCDPITGRCLCKRNVIGDKCDRCKRAHFGLMSSDPDGCQPCFCFSHTTECDVSDTYYYIKNLTYVFPRDAKEWKYVNNNDVTSPLMEAEVGDDYVTFPRSLNTRNRPYSAHLTKVSTGPFLIDMYRSYGLYVELELSFTQLPIRRTRRSPLGIIPSTGEDVRLIMDHHTYSLPFDSLDNPKPVISRDDRIRKKVFRYRLTENAPWRLNRGPAFNRALTAGEFFGFLSTTFNMEIRILAGLDVTRVHRITIMTVTSDKSSLSKDQLIAFARCEKCNCPPSFQGDSCEKCAPFHRREIVGQNHFGNCVPCRCHGNATHCDETSGQCQCKRGYAGDECEFCAPGYYGDAVNPLIGCKLCPCPLGGRCKEMERRDLTGKWRKMIVCLDCPPHRTGAMCERCESGFYGDLSNGGRCVPCHCNNNENKNAIEICDHKTGHCLACDYNTTGERCDECAYGYYGNALATPHSNCTSCECNPYATFKGREGKVICNQVTGECICRSGLKGPKCDQCSAPNSWFNMITKRCEPCNCSLANSNGTSCNFATGQCHCNLGAQGKRCDICAIHYYRYSAADYLTVRLTPVVGGDGAAYKPGQCVQCSCNPKGTKLVPGYNARHSLLAPCDPITGQCPCRSAAIGGRRCDDCSASLQFNATDSDICLPCSGCYASLKSRVEKWRDGPKWRLNQTIPEEYFKWAIDQIQKLPDMSSDASLLRLVESFIMKVKEFNISWSHITENVAKWQAVKDNPRLNDTTKQLENLERQLYQNSSILLIELYKLREKALTEYRDNSIMNVTVNALTHLVATLLNDLKTEKREIVGNRLQIEAILIKSLLLLNSPSNSTVLHTIERLKEILSKTESLIQSIETLTIFMTVTAEEANSLQKSSDDVRTTLTASNERATNLNKFLEEIALKIRSLNEQLLQYMKSPVHEEVEKSYVTLQQRLAEFLAALEQAKYHRIILQALYDNTNMANDKYRETLNKARHFIDTFNTTLQAHYLNDTLNEDKKKLDAIWDTTVGILTTKLPQLQAQSLKFQTHVTNYSHVIPVAHNRSWELVNTVNQLAADDASLKTNISQANAKVGNQTRDTESTRNASENLLERVRALRDQMKTISDGGMEEKAANLLQRLKQLKAKMQKIPSPDAARDSQLTEYHSQRITTSKNLRTAANQNVTSIKETVSDIENVLPRVETMLRYYVEEIASIEYVKQFVFTRNKLMVGEQNQGHLCVYSVGSVQ